MLCIAIGAPVGLYGLQLIGNLEPGMHRPVLFYGAALMLIAFGALLVLSGLSPKIMSRY
ncbi:hypothetical protein MKK88_05775 [Methylobacterium sp. E-005]|uniref:hypothetical protein n=1 Tax=Methylobacterium sp. E-005 TaxID=2836549 RepID=UPI001FB88832|nr:hypothetical protein [Methylobacterium sp. E-005]MCJ2085503.1 hypothetical protein [Methylobacterium sp. E-005]